MNSRYECHICINCKSWLVGRGGAQQKLTLREYQAEWDNDDVLPFDHGLCGGGSVYYVSRRQAKALTTSKHRMLRMLEKQVKNTSATSNWRSDDTL